MQLYKELWLILNYIGILHILVSLNKIKLFNQ